MNELTDLERKLITVIQHNNKRGRTITLIELELRLGHNANELQEMINDLINRHWIKREGNEWIVIRKLF